MIIISHRGNIRGPIPDKENRPSYIDCAIGNGYHVEIDVRSINGELWLLDLKTSNQLQTVYELQTAVYGQCYKECFGKKIDRYGILWLKSSKRKASTGKMQGKGWEVVESSRTFEENIDIFKTVKRLFDLENPTHSPVFTEFRTTAKREL